MINSSTLKNFKGFQNTTNFPLSKVNLLTGINGRGKSSFLQSILTLRQSIEAQDIFSKVIFNGSCVNLGSYYDVKNRNTGNNIPIEICHKLDNGEIKLSLIRDENDDMIGIPMPDSQIHQIKSFQRIHYIAADRIGPQEFYLKSTLPAFINVGTKGEFVANVLLQKRNELVHDYFLDESKEISYELEIQTGEWISKILDTENVKVFVNCEESSRVINLMFGIGQHKFRPSNVGFGYTYVLPIIVSGLIAKKGEILIVENPEAHLHPKAQSYLIKFLSIVASTGVQVFIESHSEHILNSLIISALDENINIKNSDISTLYFIDNPEKPFLQLKIEKDGAIANWPDGFFDQQEIDLAQIFRLGRKNE